MPVVKSLSIFFFCYKKRYHGLTSNISQSNPLDFYNQGVTRGEGVDRQQIVNDIMFLNCLYFILSVTDRLNI